MAYLSRRCEEGRRAVAALQGKTHRYKGVPSLSDVHADMQTCCNFNLTVVERQARFLPAACEFSKFKFK